MGKKTKARIAKITMDTFRAENPDLKCETCGRKEWLTIDHIIPVTILRDMGFDIDELYTERENLRVLCRSCNSLKHARLDFSDPRTKQLLLKYLERF